MKKECEIARDLMPLVLDEVAAEGSIQMVFQHVKDCDDCASYLEGLKAGVPTKTEEEERRELAALARAASRLKKKRRARAVRNVLLGALLACLFIFAGLLGYDRLSKATKPLAFTDYGLSLAGLSDGSLVISADYHGAMEQLMVNSQTERSGDGGAALYIAVERYWLSRRTDLPMQNGAVRTIPAADLDSYDEIRVGNRESSVALWKRGDAVEPASEQMEQYYSWLSFVLDFEDRMDVTPDGKAGFKDEQESIRYLFARRQLEALRSLVPEWSPWVSGSSAPLDEETLRWVLGKDGSVLPGIYSEP